MAEPGDPKAPKGDDHDHDAEVGFVSSASLSGRRTAGADRDLFEEPEPAYDPFKPSAPSPLRQLRADDGGAKAVRTHRARRDPEATPEPTPIRAPSSLYAVYVLILLAVPTLGAAALVALLAVWKRAAPEDDFAASHFVYQQRTVWAAAIGAVGGALLIIVNIGVFILFVAALWTLARGAYGVMKLRAGQRIPHPMAWLF
jgi:uncharacterized membrane protein